MQPRSEKKLLSEAFEELRVILAEGPGLELKPYFGDQRDHGHDAWWQVIGDDSFVGRLLVEAYTRFTPRSIDKLAYLTRANLRQMHDPTVVIVAPWLSPRSREIIAEQGWSYMDLTGNVLIRSRRPAVYIRLTGADTDPQPRERGEVLLRGARINALVRLLVDVDPPYRLRELAAAASLSEGYVSRALQSLHDQGLLERAGGGPVTSVNWPQLLRHRAQEYDLLTSNSSRTCLFRQGPKLLLKALDGDPDVVVTGSFAAERINPVASPTQLALYVPDLRDFAHRYDLHLTKTGANVVLLEPASRSQLDRARLVDGVRHAGYSQLAQDLLAGNGRLPEEGEALLEWMTDTPGWRLPALPRPHH